MTTRGPKLPRLSECRTCHEPIRFVKLDTGKALPVDPQPNPRGNTAAHLAGGQLVGFVISRDKLPGALDPFRFVPHYATCSAVERKSKKEEAAPDPALFEVDEHGRRALPNE